MDFSGAGGGARFSGGDEMKPDICTSLSCVPPQDYCPECSHALFLGEGTDKNGKLWRWEFSPRFGPLFLRKDGEPLSRQPIRADHRAWVPFDSWMKERR